MSEPIEVSPRLRESLRAALEAIQAPHVGRAEAIVTPEGLRFDVGYRPRTWLDVSASVSRSWTVGTWTGGARVGLSW